MIPSFGGQPYDVGGLVHDVDGFYMILIGFSMMMVCFYMLVASFCIRPRALSPQGNVSDVQYGCLANLAVGLTVLGGSQDSGADRIGSGRKRVHGFRQHF